MTIPPCAHQTGKGISTQEGCSANKHTGQSGVYNQRALGTYYNRWYHTDTILEAIDIYKTWHPAIGKYVLFKHPKNLYKNENFEIK